MDDLTDSDTSDLDETEKPRVHRATRGVRSLTIKRNNKGETQLHQACIAGNIELARRLIEQGHVVNVRDHAGWLPLHEACNHGYRDIVQLLLDRGAAVAINDKGGTSCDGITPLYDACSNGFLDVIELLLDRGADATVKTDFGDTCLSGLDKWRVSATLTEGEQVQYEQIRTRLKRTLSKVGICTNQINEILTNTKIDVKKNLNPRSEEICELFDANETESTKIVSNENMCPSTSRFKILKEKSKSSSPVSACLEYKNAIEQLKHPHHHKNSVENEDNSFYNSVCERKRFAYHNPERYDEDDWIIDDLVPERKKRRYETSTTKSCRSISSSENSSWHRQLSPKNDAFQELSDAAGASSLQQHKHTKNQFLARSSSISSNTSMAATPERCKSKDKLLLFENGFSRLSSKNLHFVGEDDTNEENVHSTEPDSSTSIPLLISPGQTSPVSVQTTLSTTVSFKVKVEDELLLVPIDKRKLSDMSIRWLAEEASRRYYK